MSTYLATPSHSPSTTTTTTANSVPQPASPANRFLPRTMAPMSSPSSSAIPITMDQAVTLPLASVLDTSDRPPPDTVAALLKLPGLHSDCAAVPIIQTKCIMCNKHAGGHSCSTCNCKQAAYCSKNCNEADAALHQLVCKQAKSLSTTDYEDQNRVQVIVLHAQQIKAELAWATVTDTGLKIKHPAINAFKLSRKDLVPVPDLVNHQLRNFKLTKWLGHCVLLWSLVNWAELPMEWVNRTAIFMGGKAGHSNLFYGPMVISVFKQDMLDLNTRTLDHAQMRTLRQVADYIQMVDDNPCVPSPARFESVPPRMNPVPGLMTISGVKVNDKLELELMAPFGMTASKEEVFVPISHRRQEQCAAAIPFLLGLKWYARSAKLDLIATKPQVADRVDDNLAWFQWTLESIPVANKFSQKKASAKYAHHDRSLVVVQGGGAPLRVEHIEALTMYLGLQQATDEDRAEISKQGFQNYWRENYGNTPHAPPSPYDLEVSHPESLVDEDANEMMALVAKNNEIKHEVVNVTAIRAEVLMKRLIETYVENKMVVKIINALISHDVGGKSIEDMQAKVVSDEVVSEQDLEAVRIVDALTRTHSKLELCQISEYIDGYKEEEYLSWFQRADLE